MDSHTHLIQHVPIAAVAASPLMGLGDPCIPLPTVPACLSLAGRGPMREELVSIPRVIINIIVVTYPCYAVTTATTATSTEHTPRIARPTWKELRVFHDHRRPRKQTHRRAKPSWSFRSNPACVWLLLWEKGGSRGSSCRKEQLNQIMLALDGVGETRVCYRAKIRMVIMYGTCP